MEKMNEFTAMSHSPGAIHTADAQNQEDTVERKHHLTHITGSDNELLP